MVCVYTKVSNPRSLNAVPVTPGNTVSLAKGVAAAEFLTEIVMRPETTVTVWLAGGAAKNTICWESLLYT